MIQLLLILLFFTASLQGMHHTLNPPVKDSELQEKERLAQEVNRYHNRIQAKKSRDKLKEQVAQGDPEAIDRWQHKNQLAKVRMSRAYARKVKKAEITKVLEFIKELDGHIAQTERKKQLTLFKEFDDQRAQIDPELLKKILTNE